MNRQTKYPDTDTFHYFNANPKNRITGDCAFRAISTALEQDYNTTVMEMAEMMCKTGYALNDKKGEEKYLASKGWMKHKQPRKNDGTKYTGKEWCEYLSINDSSGKTGAIIATIGGHHIVCIRPTEYGDGTNCKYKVWDTWNSTGYCIGNYYTKIEK